MELRRWGQLERAKSVTRLFGAGPVRCPPRGHGRRRGHRYEGKAGGSEGLIGDSSLLAVGPPPQPRRGPGLQPMKLRPVLTVSALYLGVLGLGFMLVPQQIGVGAVPPNASPELVAYLRIFGGPCLGIAVLNWLARNAEPSTALKAVILGNIVGFGC